MDNHDILGRLFERLKDLELRIEVDNIQSNNDLLDKQEQIEELKEIIKELKLLTEESGAANRIDVIELDKRLLLLDEKLNNVYSQLELLEDRTDVLEEGYSKPSGAVEDVVQKIILGIIGGLITFLFSRF